MSTERPAAESTSPVLEMMADRDVSVEVHGLSKSFYRTEGVINRRQVEVKAVDDIDLAIPRGETFGLVGESGSGKTTFGKALLRIIEPTRGETWIDGTNISELSKKQLKRYRTSAQMVFQDPTSSLNPRMQIKEIVRAPLKIHDIGTRGEQRRRVEELLEIVGLPAEYHTKYPTELSGGQKQRVGIARAVITDPDVVVLDEPTSALDVSVQARIVKLFDDLQERLDLTYLFISHDLSLVKSVSDWIAVMYLGKLVEVGRADEVFANPGHPYTEALLSAIPTVTEEDERYKPKKIRLEGEIPDPRNRPSGCAFRTRCPEAFDRCANDPPAFYRIGQHHYSRCFLHDE